MMLDKTKPSHVEKTLSMPVPTISTRDWLGTSLKRVGVNTSASAEWWWLVGRLALIAATAVGATLFLRETAGYSLLLSYLAFAVVYSALVALLLWRSQIDWAFVIGFIFDTGGIIGAWWITAQASAGTTNSNDMYLGLFAVLGVAMVRLGSLLGAIYAALLLLWMTWVTLTYSAPESYTVQQLPVRLLFMAITAALMLRLVGRLTQERRLADEATARYRTLYESLSDAVLLMNQSGYIVDMNQGAEALLGSVGALQGRRLEELIDITQRGTFGQRFLRALEGDELIMQLNLHVPPRNTVTVELRGSFVQIGKERLFHCIGRDITERKLAEEQIRRQVKRLAALRAIDMAITTSLDLRVVLGIVLEHLKGQLRVDAANVLLLNKDRSVLEYVAGLGFRGWGIARSQDTLGEGQAGRVAHDRRIMTLANLAEATPAFSRMSLVAGEGFVFYCCLPLIAKGDVKGVLEVFNREPLEPGQEWYEFLQSIGVQAALAIENAALLADLRDSNAELALAYDHTLEGWARALDLRDKETEGHSQRVVEWTIRLAQASGVKEAELVHIRRGALLHDMGKMGIPDSILLKPGPLTDDEWHIMRKHPIFAYEMLSPIAYLRPALDIPYAHHEKWDGTGYPRGLKGTQIPLAARIFSVIDVWDALSSDRPYRPRWSDEQVRSYLREQAGSHFEPRIVQAFLDLAGEPDAASNGSGKQVLTAVDGITARIIQAP